MPYRGTVAHANYMSLDRPDTQHAIKEACRGVAKPTDKDVARFKGLARHFQKAPRSVLKSDGETDGGTDIHMYVDAGWAGCRASRRSTGGGLMTMGGLMLKGFSSTQKDPWPRRAEHPKFMRWWEGRQRRGVGRLGMDMRVESSAGKVA